MPFTATIKVFFWQTGGFRSSLLSCAALVFCEPTVMATPRVSSERAPLLQGERERIARIFMTTSVEGMPQLVSTGKWPQNEMPAD